LTASEYPSNTPSPGSTQPTRAISPFTKEDRMTPVIPKLTRAAAPIEPAAPRPRAKWADLHEALSQLLEARTLAVEDQIDSVGGGK
jgi:hypothetical protein